MSTQESEKKMCLCAQNLNQIVLWKDFAKWGPEFVHTVWSAIGFVRYFQVTSQAFEFNKALPLLRGRDWDCNNCRANGHKRARLDLVNKEPFKEIYIPAMPPGVGEECLCAQGYSILEEWERELAEGLAAYVNKMDDEIPLVRYFQVVAEMDGFNRAAKEVYARMQKCEKCAENRLDAGEPPIFVYPKWPGFEREGKKAE